MGLNGRTKPEPEPCPKIGHVCPAEPSHCPACPHDPPLLRKTSRRRFSWVCPWQAFVTVTRGEVRGMLRSGNRVRGGPLPHARRGARRSQRVWKRINSTLDSPEWIHAYHTGGEGSLTDRAYPQTGRRTRITEATAGRVTDILISATNACSSPHKQ